ncbi:MAG TPA: DUF721 domain-containing protein [Acidimicrobiales bacterium]|nr:DUF721 domain-containing protein [Acidimicrobiales bacterium]
MSTWRPFSDGDGGPRRLRDGLERLTRSLGGPASKVLEVVFGHWEEAVGPVVAAHARPLNLSDAVLVVAVDQPAWATQLKLLESDILRRLGEAAGAPVAERLEVRVRRR